ncbi:MAG: hypothetical protein K8H84_08360 [Sulfuricella denitrificans]|nr:hypothetical protein [Sulfuricella denitrificans]
MKICLTRLLLMFMLVWLPLQGYAGESMSFCAHQHEKETVRIDAAGHQGCHHEQKADNSIVKTSVACDNCFSCHLIVQPALIVAPLVLGVDSNRMFQPPLKLSFTLFFPEQLQRPPLALFS